ncbi:hypothetical protein HD806DRAFT_546463 [Xylariaceae sp. AK1471]|nr:hypothetical protein HD806DRAFT_546463 [Xylariaceae sp. AK1471]
MGLLVRLCQGAVALVALVTVAAGDQKLLPFAFSPLPVGSVHPRGWLLDAMISQANGFPGHMYSEVSGSDGHKFYSYVRESAWLQEPGVSPSEYSDLHEAFPYWFNGLVPLAYSLQHPYLKAQVHQAARTVLNLQADDGWMGPEDYLNQERVLWGRYPLLLGLIQLAEANATWTDPVVDSLRKFMGLTNKILRAGGEGYNKCEKSENCMWSQVRVADLMITIQWLLENHPSSQNQLLWKTMCLLQEMNGYRWEGWYVEGIYQQVVLHPSADQWYFGFIHGVNVGQGLKSPAVLRRFTHNNSLLDTAQKAVYWTTSYHGSPSGSILGDEILRDNKPWMGSELCTAVETGYSLAYLYQATGNKEYADAAELVYFNALPAQTAHQGWGHQYMDQPNQPFAQYEKGWDLFTTSNTGSATMYGLEPVYPCCTVNVPQGFAKLTTHSWAHTEQAGIVHLLLSPSQVTTQVGGLDVTIECITNYPFSGTLSYFVQSDAVFFLYLRVPSWYNPKTTTLEINGTLVQPPSPNPQTGMHKIALPRGETAVTYTVGMEPRFERRGNGAVSVYVGNLLYSLDVGSAENSTLPYPFYDAGGQGMDFIPFPEARDYSYVNTKPWKVAIDPKTLKFHGMSADDKLPQDTFIYENATTHIEVEGCEVDWPLLKSMTPDVPPKYPSCISDVKTYILKPYGALKAHMSELPVMEHAQECIY